MPKILSAVLAAALAGCASAPLPPPPPLADLQELSCEALDAQVWYYKSIHDQAEVNLYRGVTEDTRYADHAWANKEQYGLAGQAKGCWRWLSAEDDLSIPMPVFSSQGM